MRKIKLCFNTTHMPWHKSIYKNENYDFYCYLKLFQLYLALRVCWIYKDCGQFCANFLAVLILNVCLIWKKLMCFSQPSYRQFRLWYIWLQWTYKLKKIYTLLTLKTNINWIQVLITVKSIYFLNMCANN